MANPNIRYLIICWRESPGHLVADALANLVQKGVKSDKRRTIIGARAPTPYLPNIPIESIDRFRKQISLVNILSHACEEPKKGMDIELIKKVIT